MKTARFLRERFVIVLFTAVALGFTVPGLDRAPSSFLIFCLAVLIFVSAFQISLTEIRRIEPRHPVIFYLLRYPALAVALWAITSTLHPPLATAVLLLSLAPAGVASPGVASIYRGNISLSILIVVMSAFLAPFLIPLVLQLFVARNVELQIGSIFQTLLVSVFLPLIAHIPLRRRPIAHWLRENDSLLVVPAIGILVMMVIAMQKAFILENALTATVFVAVSVILYLLYYLFGWLIFPHAPLRNRVSYALGSGVNNTAIVIVLATLYFSAEVTTFLVSAELAWVMSIVIFKRFLKNRTCSRSGEMPDGMPGNGPDGVPTDGPIAGE
jgi:predicted Na+-dependent transporter